jgi:hypothetical protein
MVDLYLPGASKHDLGNHGAMDGGPARATWHSTSNTRDHTFTNEYGWFTGGGADVAPHILWDPFTGQIAQFFPADSRSLSLQNDGAVRTNRTGKYNIQIEVVFTAGETVNGKVYKTIAETPRKNLDLIVNWLRSLGIPDVFPGGAPVDFSRDTVSETTWQTKGGHYTHAQVPGNSHVDPGPLGNIFGAAAPKPVPHYAAFPGDKYFYYGRTSKLVTELGKALVRAGYKGYKVGPSPVFGPGDRKGIKWFQSNHKELAGDADGHLGPKTWKLLKVNPPK